MPEPMQKKARRAALKTRRLEIEQRLAEHGLSRGPRRLLAGPSPLSEDTYCRRLREALVCLGPVFSSFGIYLASRVDLLPMSYCLELSALTDLAEVTPIASIRQIIHSSIGRSPEDAFIKFEDEPFESRLLFQSHHAWLDGREEVTVKVIHPEVEDWIDTDIQCLPVLRDVFASLELTELQIDSAIADFRRALGQQADLSQEARSLEALAQDAKEFTMLAAPPVHTHLCSSKVLTVGRLQGISLEQLVSSLNENGEEADTDSGNLANTLCLVWLREALMGSVLPVESLAANIVVLPNQQIAFVGGSFERLSSPAKTNLWNYVTSASAEDADKACACLLTQLERGKQNASEKELLHAFRQAVPFRDGAWSESGNGDSLAENLFVQWRLASRRGFQPHPDLIRFCRGLFLVAAVARGLTTKRDSLREAVENLRLIAALDQFREMVGVQQLVESVDKYAAIMRELPTRVDEVLTLAAEGSARVKLRVDQTSGQRRQKNSLASAAALIMILAACALLSRQLALSLVAAAWIDRIGAVVFVLLGAMLLRVATRG